MSLTNNEYWFSVIEIRCFLARPFANTGYSFILFANRNRLSDSRALISSILLSKQVMLICVAILSALTSIIECFIFWKAFSTPTN